MPIPEHQFRNLIETHQRMVFSLALRILGDYATAEEVAQDVFLELHRSGERLESEDHIRFWLRRTAKHRAIDAIRRKSNRPEAAADEWLESDYAAAPIRALNAGTEARLEGLLRTLPEGLRAAIILRYQEDMLPDEIASVLGQSAASVKSQLHRGLTLLRRKAAVTMKEYFREPA
ncbi:MAG TPA: sigma-70 family RNA polymerase sigma factor [Acidobacteriaceae bacterium]|jgi:RNA polymerase sigma-70 factor (ECF subfamily)|nr:sigma-70 family RNA polymerase sigma factor [Acidobacteriaceae bacterium]